MALGEYKYIKIVLILVLEVGKWQENILILVQIMDVMTI